MTVLAVFKSRSETLGYLSALRASGVPAAAVATPKEAGVGCGISVRFDERFLPRARLVWAKKRYSSFTGFMKRINFGYAYL